MLRLQHLAEALPRPCRPARPSPHGRVLPAIRTAAKFDFNDFLKQYKMVSGMGNMSQLVKMLPGALCCAVAA